jgi:hypothetical protein
MVWWAASVAAVAVVAVVTAALMRSSGEEYYSPGPKPVFPGDSGVLAGTENGPIPPEWDNGDPAVAVVGVGSDSAWFYAEGDPYVQSVDIRVGESAALDGVTITLCDVWYDRRPERGGMNEVGAPLEYPSTAYYVTSYDGSTPVCP